MNVADFLPIYGTYRGIKRSYQEDDLSIEEQVYLGGQIGASTFATIVATGGYTRGHIIMAQFAVANAFTVGAVTVAVAGPLIVGAVISESIAGEQGLEDYTQFMTEPKHMPFRTSWSIARLIEHYL